RNQLTPRKILWRNVVRNLPLNNRFGTFACLTVVFIAVLSLVTSGISAASYVTSGISPQSESGGSLQPVQQSSGRTHFALSNSLGQGNGRAQFADSVFTGRNPAPGIARNLLQPYHSQVGSADNLSAAPRPGVNGVYETSGRQVDATPSALT